MTDVIEKPRPVISRPLALGRLEIWPPVVLAPMAGITNAAFRHLCRGFGAGLYVSEMATARGIVEHWPRSEKIGHFGRDEKPRSIQIYGTDPTWTARAVERLVSEGRVDHIDLNFGCPARKITRKGGGAALPYRRRLLQAIIGAAVRAAGEVPVTAKFRLGIDQNLLTYLDAGRIAEAEGAAAVALHARTAAQLYSGRADWSRIAELKAALTIPVLGNGDIFSAEDALRMIARTQCDGVVVGRGCLGRPWLFRSLARVFAGEAPDPAPCLGDVIKVMLAHADMLIELDGESLAMISFRKHTGWYLQGYDVPDATLKALCRVSSKAGFEALLGELDPLLPARQEIVTLRRVQDGRIQKVSLPEGFLQMQDDPTPLGADAELALSGG